MEDIAKCDTSRKLKLAKMKIRKIMKDASCLSYSKLADIDLPSNKFSLGLSKVKHCVLICCFFYFAYWFNGLGSKDCWIRSPDSFRNIFYAPTHDCSFCENATSVQRVERITKKEFEDLYAYSATSVIVTDAMKNWPAVKEFSFNFFKELYRRRDLGEQVGNCAFFNYETEFYSLDEVFEMDESRANLSKGSKRWYVGWNTCLNKESEILRQYYTAPYFLPETSEPSAVDWFFMGGPGKGAHMHLDHVGLKSWQAQLRGRKKWTLAPPPECFYRCHFIEFVVEPGEIVVVDTNLWYHKTEVLLGDLSLTLGAEYD